MKKDARANLCENLLRANLTQTEKSSVFIKSIPTL